MGVAVAGALEVSVAVRVTVRVGLCVDVGVREIIIDVAAGRVTVLVEVASAVSVFVGVVCSAVAVGTVGETVAVGEASGVSIKICAAVEVRSGVMVVVTDRDGAGVTWISSVPNCCMWVAGYCPSSRTIKSTLTRVPIIISPDSIVLASISTDVPLICQMPSPVASRMPVKLAWNAPSLEVSRSTHHAPESSICPTTRAVSPMAGTTPTIMLSDKFNGIEPMTIASSFHALRTPLT